MNIGLRLGHDYFWVAALPTFSSLPRLLPGYVPLRGLRSRSPQGAQATLPMRPRVSYGFFTIAVQLLLKGPRYWLPHMLVGTSDIAKQIMSPLGNLMRIAMPKSAARGFSVRLPQVEKRRCIASARAWSRRTFHLAHARQGSCAVDGVVKGGGVWASGHASLCRIRGPVASSTAAILQR